jgi:hypothetical protein
MVSMSIPICFYDQLNALGPDLVKRRSFDSAWITHSIQSPMHPCSDALEKM